MANETGMPRLIDDLERLLLRRGVGELEAGRDCCVDCGRTPLIGERVHRYDRGALVCELCRPRRRQAPDHAEVVRHCEYGHTVRMQIRPAA